MRIEVLKMHFLFGTEHRLKLRQSLPMNNISAPIGLSRTFSCNFMKLITSMGHAVAQLAEALRYKPEGSGFDSRWGNWDSSLT